MTCITLLLHKMLLSCRYPSVMDSYSKLLPNTLPSTSLWETFQKHLLSITEGKSTVGNIMQFSLLHPRLCTPQRLNVRAWFSFFLSEQGSLSWTTLSFTLRCTAQAFRSTNGNICPPDATNCPQNSSCKPSVISFFWFVFRTENV